MKNLILTLFTAPILFCSCSDNTNSDKSIIDVASVVGKGSVHNVSEFIKEIKYIPLETGPNSMVDIIKSLTIENDKIYIGDEKGVINIFDINGKYLTTLNRIGKGPEEYLGMLDFTVTTEENIYILTMEGEVIWYDTDLKFIKRMPLPKNAMLLSFTLLKSELFASRSINISTNPFKQEWIVYDNMLNILFSYDSKPNNSFINPPTAYIYDNTLRLYSNKSDTIFNVDIENNYSLSAGYITNYGKYSSLETENSNNSISLGYIIETSNYLFLRFNFNQLAPEPFEMKAREEEIEGGTRRIGGGINREVYAVYNKKGGELALLNQPVPGTLGLKNDLTNGPAFYPRFITVNQKLIAWHEAHELISLAEEGKIDKSIVANLKENDNPVIVIATPK